MVVLSRGLHTSLRPHLMPSGSVHPIRHTHGHIASTSPAIARPWELTGPPKSLVIARPSPRSGTARPVGPVCLRLRMTACSVEENPALRLLRSYLVCQTPPLQLLYQWAHQQSSNTHISCSAWTRCTITPLNCSRHCAAVTKPRVMHAVAGIMAVGLVKDLPPCTGRLRT